MKWHLDPQMSSVGKLIEDVWHKLWNDSNKKRMRREGCGEKKELNSNGSACFGWAASWWEK